MTERQYSLYLKRRYDCMKDYVDKLKSGEEKLPVPSTSFEWNVYHFFITAHIRATCSGRNYMDFNQDYHDEIMKMFGDDLFEIYKKNK